MAAETAAAKTPVGGEPAMPSSGSVTAAMLGLNHGRRRQEQESRKGQYAPHVHIISPIRGGDAAKN